MTRLATYHVARPGMLAMLAACVLFVADGAPAGCVPADDQAVARSDAPGDAVQDVATDVATTSLPAAPATTARSPKPTATADGPPAPPPLRGERIPPPPLQTGWAMLTEHADAKVRAWVEGEVIGGDQFIINTQNTRRFTLDLTRVRLNWNKRIVLRMDGFNSELTRKRWPALKFVRTAAGAWDVEAD